MFVQYTLNRLGFPVDLGLSAPVTDACPSSLEKYVYSNSKGDMVTAGLLCHDPERSIRVHGNLSTNHLKSWSLH